MVDRNSFKIVNKNKELVLFRNGKFLFSDGGRLLYGDILFIEMPTNNLLGVRAHNLKEAKIYIEDEKVEELKKWLLQINEEKHTFKENIIKKKKEKKVNDGGSENNQQTKEE
jgi:hypothetical protein